MTAANRITHGFVAPGLERVAEAFETNFAERREVGAAFAATLDGRPVVDLWGGLADRAAQLPWREDTLLTIFSGTKGLVALCIAMLELRLDDPVSLHWPEFAAEGKGEITVAEVVSHRARLPGVRTPLTEQDVTDPRAIAERLAAQAPETDPRARFVYHALTYGWLCGELVRRIDGRTVGCFLAEEVCAPLGLELWLGLPAGFEARVATLEYAFDWGQTPGTRVGSFAGDDVGAAIWENPFLFPAERLLWNLSSWRVAEIAGANAIGTARSIARLYGALSHGGELDGVRLVSAETLAEACRPLASGEDRFLGKPMVFGAGFALQDELGSFGPVEEAFGHAGAGGSIHGAWQRERIGFSYAMNQLRDDPAGDRRPLALLEALHACVC